MRRFYGFICGVAFACSACGIAKEPPAAAHFQKGFDAYKEGDFDTAVLYLKPLVENDHPGAQLLMSKMYAAGQGVPENMAISEELKNKAALRMYSLTKLKPGQIDPASQTLQVLEKRIDYYVNGLEKGAPAPEQNSAALYAPDMNGIAQTLTANEKSVVASEPESFVAAVKNSVQTTVEKVQHFHAEDFKGTRSVGQISLSNLLTEASLGDKNAVRQVARVYREGLYGLKPNPAEAAAWEKKQ